jgi:hypothetical protein
VARFSCSTFELHPVINRDGRNRTFNLGVISACKLQPLEHGQKFQNLIVEEAAVEGFDPPLVGGGQSAVDCFGPENNRLAVTDDYIILESPGRTVEVGRYRLLNLLIGGLMAQIERGKTKLFAPPLEPDVEDWPGILGSEHGHFISPFVRFIFKNKSSVGVRFPRPLILAQV